MSALFTGPGRLSADLRRPAPVPDVLRDLDAEFFVDWQVELSEPFTVPPSELHLGIFAR